MHGPERHRPPSKRPSAQSVAEATDSRRRRIRTDSRKSITTSSERGRLLFVFSAAMAEAERENLRGPTLKGLDTAACNGKHGGCRWESDPCGSSDHWSVAAQEDGQPVGNRCVGLRPGVTCRRDREPR
ncbi:recombinase family protein [Streptomyces sp. A012304]|uniref:recombinase family protein n=1 Tax=Streptomyces sp. A012304 TaxID=375446 RepID=UPI0022314FB2|nr:recombinase family protein [Streptomyces sp. A012304]